MSDPDVIGQIDALIGRHRNPGAPEEDLPVLTEVVEEDAATMQQPSGSESDAARLSAQRLALARELEAWLDEQLPDAVLRVLDGLSDQLIAQVAARARLELLPKLKAALEERLRDT